MFISFMSSDSAEFNPAFNLRVTRILREVSVITHPNVEVASGF